MTRLISFLNSGRPVYAEGGDFGFNNSTSELWPFFGASYLGDGQPSSTGNVQSLTGETGTFAGGLSFEYPFQQGPDNYVDEFGAEGGTVVLRSQDGIGRAVCNEASGYRTVLSSTIFGATSGTDRDALMAACMNYLVLGTGISQGDKPQPAARAAVVPSVARVGRAVRLQTSGLARELSVLDVSGRVVTHWQLPAGDAVTTWNVGSEVVPGAYLLQVRAKGRTDTRPFTIVR
jgi:hypothetical protein